MIKLQKFKSYLREIIWERIFLNLKVEVHHNLALVQICGSGCYMSVGRPSSQLWVNLLQYVGWASPNFVVDLVHAIGFSMAGAYCSSHFCL